MRHPAFHVAVGALAGVCAGALMAGAALVPRLRAARDASARDAADAHAAAGDLSRARGELVRARAGEAEAAAKAASAAAARDALARELAALRAAQADGIVIPRADLDGVRIYLVGRPAEASWPPRVSDRLGRLLRLTPEEREAIDGLLRAAARALERAEAGRVIVKETGDARVVIEIAAYADEGARVRRGLVEPLERLIGQTRLDDWRALQREFPDDLYGGFGRAAATVTVERKEEKAFTVRQDTTAAGARASRTASGGPELLASIGRLAQYLPASMRAEIPAAPTPGAAAPATPQTAPGRDADVF